MVYWLVFNPTLSINTVWYSKVTCSAWSASRACLFDISRSSENPFSLAPSSPFPMWLEPKEKGRLSVEEKVRISLSWSISSSLTARVRLQNKITFYHMCRLIVANRSSNELRRMDTGYILSFNVNEQLLMVIHNGCEVNREHARICRNGWSSTKEIAHERPIEYKTSSILVYHFCKHA